nr:MAG TPA: hypothetical protein [Microviridae sp.]
MYISGKNRSRLRTYTRTRETRAHAHVHRRGRCCARYVGLSASTCSQIWCHSAPYRQV